MSRSDLVNYCNCVCQSASCVDAAEQDVHAANCPATSPAFCSSVPCRALPAASIVSMSRDPLPNGGTASSSSTGDAASEHQCTRIELLRVLRITQFVQRYEYELAIARVLEGEQTSEIFKDIWDLLPAEIKAD